MFVSEVTQMHCRLDASESENSDMEKNEEKVTEYRYLKMPFYVFSPAHIHLSVYIRTYLI